AIGTSGSPTPRAACPRDSPSMPLTIPGPSGHPMGAASCSNPIEKASLTCTGNCRAPFAVPGVLFWIMESLRIIEKPKRRGRFSQQRDVWDLVHQERFNRWLEGDPVEAIAEKHYVDVSQCSSVGCESYGSWPPPRCRIRRGTGAQVMASLRNL